MRTDAVFAAWEHTTAVAGRHRVLAWTLGGGGALACALSLVLLIGLGIYVPLGVINLSLIAGGLLGALIASRQPRNAVGWVLCAGAIAGSLLYLPFEYGYSALVLHHGAWPLGGVALWLATWAYAPSLGMFFTMLSVRFPDGIVRRGWRFVDWLATAGMVAYVGGVAFETPAVARGFLPVSERQLFVVLAHLIHNPLGSPLPEGVLAALRLVALTLIVVAYIAAVVSLMDRFRNAPSEQRAQIKWFAYSGVIMAGALVYGFVWRFLTDGGFGFLITGRGLGDALIPLTYAAITLPLAVAIAILRYRLYEIDLIINRTLVYGGLTAVLGAVYAAVITLLNRFFISASGQKSDAAYVVTAFVVVIASSPVKDWLQRQVDRRIRHAPPAAVLDQFRADVEAVVSVIDVHRVARRLVDEAIEAFDARGAALYLHSSDVQPMYSRGHLNGQAEVEIALHYEDRHFGRLVMGSRRGDISYTEHDRAALQRSADTVGEALALAAHLGFQPLSRTH